MRIRVLGHYVHLPLVALAAAEAVLFVAVMVVAALIRFQGSLEEMNLPRGSIWTRALLFSVITMVCLLAFGMYSSRQRARASGIVLRVMLAMAASLVVTSALFYLIPNLWLGRGVMAMSAVGALVGSAILRIALARASENSFKRRVLVYGAGQRAYAITNLRRRADRRGFTLVGYVEPDGETAAVPAGQILRSGESLMQLCDRLDVDEVVVAMEDRRRGFPLHDLLECRLAGVEVTELLTFLERETGRVRIDVMNPSWMIFGEGFRRDPMRLATARLLDLLSSVAILLVAWPFMLLTALAIKLEDGWGAPVLYRQDRVGFAGRSFPLYKFRSMRVDAERDGKAQWAQKNDSRVTKVGAFIRKVRLDELPQLFNVLAGHMSFVGPRPERPQFVAELSERIPYYDQRHCVKPGITGWAQLCYPYGSSEQDAIEKLQYDLYYIKNNTLLFDLAILVQTAEVVFMGKGAR